MVIALFVVLALSILLIVLDSIRAKKENDKKRDFYNSLSDEEKQIINKYRDTRVSFKELFKKEKNNKKKNK